MVKRLYLLFILALCAAIGILVPVHAATWILVWNDEFSGSSIDRANWNFETGPSDSWNSGELDYCTNGANVRIQDGVLVIEARQENVGGMNYTSARINTKGKREFTYGKIEARIAIPTGKGLWPQFWMLGANYPGMAWPGCGEIDIMSHTNTDRLNYGSIYWDNNGCQSYGANVRVSNITSYHVYSIEWSPATIKWFVDGIQYCEGSLLDDAAGMEEFQKPFFIVLNLAVGGNWAGSPDAKTVFPAKMLVDYIRVYQDEASIKPTSSPTPLPASPTPKPTITILAVTGKGIPGKIEAENYDDMSGIQTEACSEGGLNVVIREKGGWMDYHVRVRTTGSYQVSYRVASPSGTGQIQLLANSDLLATSTIPNTGGWQSWITVKATVNLKEGTQTLRLYARWGGFNINWITFEQRK